MISQIAGTLIRKDLAVAEVMTAGGIAYEMQIPLSVFETLPKTGESVTLFTSLVVKEDSWQLFGFTSLFERRVFEKVLTANGVGPALAIGLLSSLTAPRLVRAIVEKDIPALQSVPRVGRKKAERIILDLSDKMGDVQPSSVDTGGAKPAGASAEDAIRALVSLGYTTMEAERGVRAALDEAGGGLGAPELIRAALAKVGGR